MLFKVVMDGTPEQNQGETLLGYAWIEVLAVLPWWITHIVGDDGEDRGWRIDHHYLCRTEHGLTYLTGRDLDTEIDCGIYVEDGKQSRVDTRCCQCETPTTAADACTECERWACDDHATGKGDDRMCNECSGL